MKPVGNINGPWELSGYIDADSAEVNDTQKSVTVFVVLIDGSVIAWPFLSQKTVTISVTEA